MVDRKSSSSPARKRVARREAAPPTELDRARARLEDVEARLHAILDTAVDGIITIDESGAIESVNAAVERMFGYSADELVGRNVSLLMFHADREHHDEHIRRYLETGEKQVIGIGREVDGRRRDGSRIALDLALSETCVHGRRLFTGILRDISARRRAEFEARRRLDELAHAGRASTLGEFTMLVAHEVNQPLAAIVSFAEACLRMLHAEKRPTEKLDNALQQIVAQGQRAGEIIRRLRRLARKGVAMRESVELNALLSDVLKLFTNELHAGEVAVELDLREGLPRISCDRIQIEQVVINLLRNAMEAMEQHPIGERIIRLRTRICDGPAVELSVEDHGNGIDAAHAQRIFETFFTTKRDGMGMGLSVSRTIVETHGGQLWATSGEQGGAVFHVLLPVEGGA